MILIDTNIWITHFRSGDKQLSELLLNGDCLLHPMVFAELYLGEYKKSQRSQILQRLRSINSLTQSADQDVFEFIDKYKLPGKAVGWIDCHLLHACKLAGVKIYTGDKKLKIVAQQLNLSF